MNLMGAHMPERTFPMILLVLTFTFRCTLSEFEDDKFLPVKKYVNSRTNQIIKYWGYPAEVHKVLTEDGYILTNFRIPNPGGYPVLMLHGLTVNSDCWFLRTPRDDFVFLLWKKGYDVWLWNARGNMYSREHVNISFTDQKKFFDFTFHELGVYDTTATIDYVLNVTGYKNLITLGHSLGTTNIMVAASMKPEYNEKVALSILWAQSAFMGNMKVKYIMDTIYSVYIRWLDFPHDTEFFVYGHEPEQVKSGTCAENSPFKVICVMALRELSGPMSNQGNPYSGEKMLNRIPTGSSILVMKQMVQNFRSGQFKPLNQGRVKNLKRYGVKKLPPYPLEKVTVPHAIYFACCNDYLSSAEDNRILKEKLPNVVQFYEVPYKRFNHGDFLWAKDSYKLVYGDVLAQIDKYSSGQETSKPRPVPAN